MISALDISTSGLLAQRARLDAIAGNIANVSSVKNENGELKPYQSRYVVLQTDEQTTTSGAAGVNVVAVRSENKAPTYRYDPGHPLAIKSGPQQGFVAQPNINLTQEFTDALAATRAYEANIGVMEISKYMGQQTLRILA